MGSIIQNAANNIGANGVFSSSALNNASLSGITALPSGAAGKPKLISTQTASSSSSISFTSGIDSTYDIYQFEFINIHPQTNGFLTEFNLSTDGGSNYNVVKTSTAFRPFHYESDGTDFGYNTYNDLAQSTAYQPLCENQGNNNDDSMSGHLILFNPSSSTYVKHWISNVNMSHNASYPASVNWFTAGYGNTTSPINAIIFRISSGNIDAGTIKMYGISA